MPRKTPETLTTTSPAMAPSGNKRQIEASVDDLLNDDQTFALVDTERSRATGRFRFGGASSSTTLTHARETPKTDLLTQYSKSMSFSVANM